MAFRRRRHYEHETNNIVVKILLGIFLLSVFYISIKAILYILFDTDNDIEVRLRKAAEPCSSPRYAILCNCFYQSSVVVGMWLLRTARLRLPYHRFQSQTLSESFEIKQSQKIAVMYPVVLVCFILGCLGLPCEALTVYIAFAKDLSPIWMELYRMFINLDYFFISLYTIFATLYAYWKFGIIIKLQPKKVHYKDNAKEIEVYFNSLVFDWEDKYRKRYCI
ncbi:unnamed protein product [Bursaphelenchus okinawaensis]|uniref:Uncharacterized protein n=1 Tax=Bursaphelenchus okinawaensis TaxID=465554 RepID=A0A811L204_9BILA|nr:unnamed protein product [Bursaphelenchus okinawaensis]CAG9115047.1 unnamed protein product [Bursaphelenchus okinawaensis]